MLTIILSGKTKCLTLSEIKQCGITYQDFWYVDLSNAVILLSWMPFTCQLIQ